MQSAILDGAVVEKDAAGRDNFLDLMRRREGASYVAFDLLWLNGRDLRSRPLTERKRALRKILPRRSKLIREAQCVPERGRKPFALVLRHDLEGTVAKRQGDACTPSAKWIKMEAAGSCSTAPEQCKDSLRKLQQVVCRSVFVVTLVTVKTASTMPTRP